MQISSPQCGEAAAIQLHELDLLDKDLPDVRLGRGNVLTRLGRREEARTVFALFLRVSRTIRGQRKCVRS